MSLNVYIDRFAGNTVAVLASEDKLIEYFIEKSKKTQIVGSVYKGKVKNVLSGINACFVDVGLEKNGYLSVGDTLIDKNLLNEDSVFSELNLKEEDEIIVQAVKDPTKSKGVRLTKHLSLVGKNIVYMPTFSVNAVSRKITDEKVRQKLEKTLGKIKRNQGGFIARTASENATTKEINSEAKNLICQYEEILENYKTAKIGDVLYSDGDLVMRIVRDILTCDVENVFVADEEIYNRLKNLPKSRDKIRKKLIFFNEKEDMFKKFNLTSQIESLLRNRVDLSSGAYLIIDKTEALTVIDVNTGSFIGEERLEDTVFQTNLLAAKEIARQVRLRNISGIVVVDFIDMQSEEHRNELVNHLSEELKKDRLKCNVIGMTGLGIVEFTRRKKRKAISEILNKDCPYCKGEGKILSNDYIIMKIRTGLLDVFSNDFSSAIIDVNAEICDYILKSGVLYKDVNKFFKDKRIYLIPHKSLHQESFYIRGDNSQVLSLPETAKLLY